MTDTFLKIREKIMLHESNKALHDLGYLPLFSGSPTAKIVIIGQAPGKKAQTNDMVWSDASGNRLLEWLGINEEMFRDPTLIAHVPMDFYYPGKGKSGDNPPRKEFAGLWHPEILSEMPNVELTVLIGKYAQNYYLADAKAQPLTETVRNFEAYLPAYFPIVHPSPLNFRWLKKNKWFERRVVPELQDRVRQIISKA